jgi:hypothetical protein
MSAERVLIDADFSACPDGEVPPDWWVEGGERVWVEKGRLRMKADPPGARDPGYVSTAWHRTPVSGDLRVDFDAHVLGSTVEANNINFFLLYSDPCGRPLFESRADRADGGYAHYHDLNGYIVTFLNDTENQSGKARFRMRRCPGFELVDENYTYHCRAGVTYHAMITRAAGALTFAVDGEVFLRWHDPAPLAQGLIGLRTYHTDLWWNRIRVTSLA